MENKKFFLEELEKLYLSVTKDKFLILSFLNQEVFPLSIDMQEDILNVTIRNPISQGHPPPLSYQKFFLRLLIDKVEFFNCECSDSLVEAYAEVISQKDKSNGFYTYKINHDCIITLEESSCFVSNGTTGLQTWEASKYLVEWCMQNKHLLKNKQILELGCGIGLLGMAVLKQCEPLKYTFTDSSWDVMRVLASNLSLNFPGADNRVEKHQLAWSEFTNNCKQFNPDIILGADIVFDVEMTKSLVSALQHLLTKSSSKAYIASTVRNPETNKDFQSQLASANLKYNQVSCIKKSIFLYNPKSTFILYEICKENVQNL